MKGITLVAAVFMSAALVVLLPATAEANDTECTGTMTGGTFDNVVVPPGATCVLINATVLGNVKALEDSRLRIDFGNIFGNVEGDKADVVQIFVTDVRGQISIKEGGPAVGPAPEFQVCGNGMDFTTCEVAIIGGSNVFFGGIQIEKMVGTVLIAGARVRENVKVEANVIAAPEILFLQNNRVSGNFEVFKNTGNGNKQVLGNNVHQSLQCFEHDPPFFAAGNIAGNAQGQCVAP
jgi:hypothetical protein